MTAWREALQDAMYPVLNSRDCCRTVLSCHSSWPVLVATGPWCADGMTTLRLRAWISSLKRRMLRMRHFYHPFTCSSWTSGARPDTYAMTARVDSTYS